MAELGWIDWTLLAVLAVSMVIGLMRGFVFEVMSLAGWLVAWFAAQWLAPQAAVYVPIGTPGSTLNFAAAFVACFLAAIVVWGLLSKLVRLLIQATPLSIPDRLLGAGFGLVRGAVLLLAVATTVALTPAAKSPPWQASHGARWLEIARHGLMPLLPADVARRFPA
jgi:membrane protein required for colicin V production